MSDELLARARAFRDGDPDPATQRELGALIDAGDLAELRERMAGPLEFGTAGLRGVLGAGESRMNRAVVRRTTAGLAAYLARQVPDARERGVVVGHDARHQSRAFAEDCAAVLAAAGFRVWLFADVGPTPLVAFGVLHHRAACGVMVTASHNPPEYNGYKVYWEDGAQIIPPHDAGISAAIAAQPPAREVPLAALDAAQGDGRVATLSPEVTEAYFQRIAALGADARGRDGVRIVVTAMHGTGAPWTREALRRAGFSSVSPVPEQELPDPDFPTVKFPNPEEPGAMDLALAQAAREGANLVLANDPDADRLAVAIPARAGWRLLTGNEIGALLGEYLLRARPEGGASRLVLTTIVSSPLLGRVAEALGVRYAETLTGLKWICAEARRQEAEGARFVFGYEEALGYCVGNVRDKDGVSAAAVFAELAAVAGAEGRTVEDELGRIAQAYGLYVSGQHSVVHKGADGLAAIRATMARLRASARGSIGGLAVVGVRDVEAGTCRRADGAVSALSLPRSDVVMFDLEGGSRVVARPSGTEPKIKFYFDVCERWAPGEPFDVARARAEARRGRVVAEFLELAGA